MKNICKKVIAIATMMALALSCNVAVNAAEPTTSESVCDEVVKTSENTISPQSNTYESGGVYVTSTAWKTIATSTSGFNCNVHVYAMTNAAYVSIRMLDRNGNVVWSETNSVPGNQSRNFWCGSNVYKIQAKAITGNATVACWPVD